MDFHWIDHQWMGHLNNNESEATNHYQALISDRGCPLLLPDKKLFPKIELTILLRRKHVQRKRIIEKGSGKSTEPIDVVSRVRHE